MADALSRQEIFFNINFSNPHEPTDKLVELMRGAQTSNETLIAGAKFVRSLNMVPIVTYKEIMGFSFNRVWRAIKREVLHLVDQGYSDFQDIDRAWIMEFGTPFGPFGLMDIIGLDVVRDIEKQYYLDSGEERDKPPKLLDVMIDQGKLGVKSGEGFYAYPDPAYKNLHWLNKQGTYYEDISVKLLGGKE
jgi:3-hydroxybutyryl-CoA dehydrogenase